MLVCAPLFLALLCLAPTSIWRRSNIPHAPRGAPAFNFFIPVTYPNPSSFIFTLTPPICPNKTGAKTNGAKRTASLFLMYGTQNPTILLETVTFFKDVSGRVEVFVLCEFELLHFLEIDSASLN